jgi:hypothetical protein
MRTHDEQGIKGELGRRHGIKGPYRGGKIRSGGAMWNVDGIAFIVLGRDKEEYSHRHDS